MSNNLGFDAMAARLNERLQDMRDANKAVEDCEANLKEAREHLKQCEEKFMLSRDSLYKEHPEMLVGLSDLRSARAIADRPQA